LNINKARQSPRTEPRLFYGYILVAAAFCIIFLTAGTQVSYGIFFKPLLAEFGWSRATTSGAFSLSWIIQGLIGIVMGRLSDRLGPRIVLTICGFLLGIGYFLMSQISTVWQLYVFYGIIIGIGMSGTLIPLQSAVARWFVARRGIMTGIILTGTALGTTVGAPVANWLIRTYDWRVSYIILSGLVFVVVVLLAQLLRRDPAQMGQIPYGQNDRAKPSLKLTAKAFSLSQALYTRQLWTVVAMFFCLSFPLFAITVHIVPHATDLGISATTAASILATLGALSIVGRVGMGSAGDRIGSIRTFIIGFAIMSAALLWLMPAKEAWGLYLFAAIFGFASAGAGALTSPLVAELFGLRSHGLILGVTQLGFAIGAAVGPLVAGYLFDVTSTYSFTFMLCAVTSIVGLVLSIVLKPTTDNQDRRRAIRE
jgi:MFS family permease